MQKIKKDNLTDLVGEVTKPQEAISKPNEATPPPKPPEGLNDYQVYTPDGEVIDLDISLTPPMVLKTKEGKRIKKILGATDAKGNQYVLIVDEIAS